MNQLNQIKQKIKKSEIELQSVCTQNEIDDFEKQAGVTLPEEYKSFLLEVGNGGKENCNLLSLDEWNYSLWKNNADLTTDLKNDCLLTPELEKLGDGWLDSLGVSDWEVKWDNDRWSPMYGSMSIATIGCGLYFSQIVNGKYKGRIFVWGDAAYVPPCFQPQNSYLGFIEYYIDRLLDNQRTPVFKSKNKIEND